jgi:diacylglycerol O-acyltransferase / wax synthase
MSSHPMPSADAAWLHMDGPLNPMVVNALIWFDEPLDHGRIRALLDRRLASEFPRFRQRVSEPLGRAPRFADDPDFDLGQHVHRLAVPAPGDQAALQELVSDLITPPLDSTRPLWHAYLIDGFRGGGAVLFRIHHCIADGIALARVMLSLTDDQPEAGIGPPGSPPAASRSGALRSLLRPAAGLVSAGQRVASTVAHEGMETLVHPSHAQQLAAAAGRDAGTLVKLLSAPADARTVLKSRLQGTRRVAWSTPFPLDRIKRAGRRSNATVNDMLVTAVSGALHNYLDRRDSPTDELHIMVPFNLRPLDAPLPRDLGNDFALILLSLPVGLTDRGERLGAVKSRMDEVKNSHEGPISYGILSAMGLTPPAVEDRLISFFSDKASAVVTNVPGPRAPVFFAGNPVRGVLVWAPCSGNMGMTVSLFSYDGELTAGFMADVALVPDPQELADGFDAELRALCRGTRTSRRAATPG